MCVHQRVPFAKSCETEQETLRLRVSFVLSRILQIAPISLKLLVPWRTPKLGLESNYEVRPRGTNDHIAATGAGFRRGFFCFFAAFSIVIEIETALCFYLDGT